MGKLTLKTDQDGLGYFYGQYQTDAGDSIRVDVLPPRSYPRPYFVAANDTATDNEWIIYAEGDEIARDTRREELDTLDLDKLLPTR